MLNDDAEWLRFGIDPQRRAAFQTFVTETVKRIPCASDLKDDCEMEMWAKLLTLCLKMPDKPDAYFKKAMLNAARKFLGCQRDYDGLFCDLSVVPD